AGRKKAWGGRTLWVTCTPGGASVHVSARMETQSSVRHAGMTPAQLSTPRVGLSPTVLVKPAGTRPEPAVSVPSAKLTMPVATAAAEPELDPPAMYRSLNGLATGP